MWLSGRLYLMHGKGWIRMRFEDVAGRNGGLRILEITESLGLWKRLRNALGALISGGRMKGVRCVKLPWEDLFRSP